MPRHQGTSSSATTQGHALREHDGLTALNPVPRLRNDHKQPLPHPDYCHRGGLEYCVHAKSFRSLALNPCRIHTQSKYRYQGVRVPLWAVLFLYKELLLPFSLTCCRPRASSTCSHLTLFPSQRFLQRYTLIHSRTSSQRGTNLKDIIGLPHSPPPESIALLCTSKIPSNPNTQCAFFHR